MLRNAAQWCDLHPAGAGYQTDTECLLKAVQVLAQQRFGDAQLATGGTQAASVDYRGVVSQVIEIQWNIRP